jgi:hypothetical protein
MLSSLARLYRDVHQGVNYRLRTFAGGRWARHCRPTSIVLLVTEYRNARCLHCDIWKNRGKEDSATLDQWQTDLRDLWRWLGPEEVTISGGEALLKPFTPELVRHGISPGLFMEILTNGYWPDQMRIEARARQALASDPLSRRARPRTVGSPAARRSTNMPRRRCGRCNVCGGTVEAPARSVSRQSS